MSSAEWKVCIIDDDEDIRTSLSRALGKRGFDVDTYPSAVEFLETHNAKRPACLILDQGMPEMTGLELQKELTMRGIVTAIIFITGHGGVAESVEAMKAGAIDFIEKPFRPDLLVDRINTAFKILSRKNENVNKALLTEALFENLTPREREIVDMMVANPSMTSSKEVALKLDISPRTVDHHRARILEKLQIRSVAELMELALSAA